MTRSTILATQSYLVERGQIGSHMEPPELFCKKGVPKNFAIFTRKYLCWNLFLMLQTFRQLPSGM